AFARAPNGGLILTGTGSGARRELIITLAARHQLPAVYPFPFHVISGGLTSYGPDVTHNYRLAAGDVDRILRGEKPADLPVQAPTKYRLAINLKNAKARRLNRPPMLLARADGGRERRAVRQELARAATRARAPPGKNATPGGDPRIVPLRCSCTFARRPTGWQ